MYRQLSLSGTDAVMYFAVKFYCPDPSRLEDELTRFEIIYYIMHAFHSFVEQSVAYQSLCSALSIDISLVYK